VFPLVLRSSADRQKSVGKTAGAVPTPAPPAVATNIILVNVVRKDKSESYGIGLGDTADGEKLITKVGPGPCFGKLMVNDKVKAVNGKAGLSHAELVQIIQGGVSMDIHVERVVGAAPPAPSHAPEVGNQGHFPSDTGPTRQHTISKVAPKTHVVTRSDDFGATTGSAEIAVELVRPNMQSSFGFGLGDTGSGMVVSTVAEGGLADGKLQTGDKFVSCNGQPCAKTTHQQLVGLITSGVRVAVTVQRNVALQVGRKESISQVHPDAVVAARADNLGSGIKERVKVGLKRPNMTTSWGFGLAESATGEKLVTKVSGDGVSAGLLVTNDVIIVANGRETLDMSHAELVGVLTAGLDVNLIVGRVSGTIDANEEKRNSVITTSDSMGSSDLETVVLHLKRPSEKVGWGFGLAVSAQGDKMVSSVAENGMCDGQLMAADTLRELNGQKTNPLSHAEVVKIITSSVDLLVTVERAIIRGKFVNRHGTISKVRPKTRIASRADNLGEGSTGKITLQLIRRTKSTSFGFVLGMNKGSGEHIVTAVNPKGLSDGKLEVNDVVISITGKSVVGLTHEEVIARVKESMVIKMVVQRSNAVDGQIVEISRESPAQSFGFGVVEHVDANLTHISAVNSGGMAEGVLMVGDVVLGINGMKAATSSHNERVQVIKSSLTISLTIQRQDAAEEPGVVFLEDVPEEVEA
jgi:hypothetical protein